MREQHGAHYVHCTLLDNCSRHEVMMQIRKPTRLPATRSTSVVVPGRGLAAWEDEVTARYDIEGLRREALLVARADQPAYSAEVPSSGVTPIDVVEVTFDPQIEVDVPAAAATIRQATPSNIPRAAPAATQGVPLYVLKGLLTCYTEFMGAAAKTVLKQEMLKLGVTPQSIQRPQLPTVVGRLAARLDTRTASDAFLRAVRLVDPALCTY